MELLIFKARSWGGLGPLLFIGLMVLAIVFNPLPSAPIAIAAGAVYGHTWGTVYIVIGAEIGALAAFLIARFIGADLVSYAAGLSAIKFWRFGLATLLGLVPVSFALAHAGSEMIGAEQTKLAAIVLIIGLLMGIPLVVGMIRLSAKTAQSDQSGKP